uniref:Putative ovule protein n=1 Tax=Solanum chacoense TaxID=4108 RepID=A0A0V0ICC4_SOLCH
MQYYILTCMKMEFKCCMTPIIVVTYLTFSIVYNINLSHLNGVTQMLQGNENDSTLLFWAQVSCYCHNKDVARDIRPLNTFPLIINNTKNNKSPQQ